jgi:kinesin family protein C2/C3
MKSQIASLEDELKAAQEESAAARRRATTMQTSLTQIQAASTATLHQREAQLQEEIESLTLEAESAKILAEEWEQRCFEAEEIAATATAEADVIKTARSTITHDLNAVRAQLADVQRQAEDFQRRFLSERAERRRLHEELQTLRGNIRVVCRVRPCEIKNKPLAVSFPMEAAIRVAASERRISEYEFSSVLEPQSTQQDVFEEVWTALRSCLDGHNVCILAYGQTGSGKTHTIIGNEENPGIAPRALRALFDVARKEDATNNNKRKFSVSMLEIYLDSVNELLVLPTTATNTTSNESTAALEVLGLGPLTPDHVAAGVERVPGRNWLPVSCADDALAALAQGCAARTTASTTLNASSSRSHVILTLKLQDESTNSSSMLSLVDLAGSERVARSEAQGLQLREAQAINKSLSALGDVMAALQAGSPHVPYRNSKLTCLLQDSLGGSSKVLLACCVAPEFDSAGETFSTLNFAQRAALVELGPSIACGGTFEHTSNGTFESTNGISFDASPLRERVVVKRAASSLVSTPVGKTIGAQSSLSASKIPSPTARLSLNTPTPTSRPSSAARASPLRPQN